jgi:uncharacterized membrane protein required for colicin V production
MVCMMLMAVAPPPTVAYSRFNYVDVIALVWLIIGLFRGRKRGMSQEVLPLLQWIGIVVAAGTLYWSFSPTIHLYTQFGKLWSNITAYLLIAVGVHLIYLWMKQMLAAKITESDPFGRGEYYLGMMSGVVRFACMILVALALMNSRVVTSTELAQTEKFQERWFSDIRFPTYGEFQQDVLFKSFTGKMVTTYLNPILIATVNVPGSQKKGDSMAQKKNQEIDDILSQPGKK